MEKKENNRLESFLNSYDYSFWYHRIVLIDEIIKDENFINKVSARMRGANVEKIRRSLAFEMFMTSQHLIETLFMLIGAFTYNPKDPWAWINDKGNYARKISNPIKDGNYQKFLDVLKLQTVSDYICYLFYDIPTLPEFKEKLDRQIEPTKECLKLLAIERSLNDDLYNAYKHGFIAFRGTARIRYQKPSRMIDILTPEIPMVAALPKKRAKNIIVEFGDEFKVFDIGINFAKLDYERQHKISEFALNLIRNIIESRRIKIHRRKSIEIVPLPGIEEIVKVFGFNKE